MVVMKLFVNKGISTKKILYLELIFNSGSLHDYFGYIYYIRLTYIIIVYLCCIPYISYVYDFQ